MTRFLDRIAKRRFLAALESADCGHLVLTTPEGECYSFGTSGPEADIHISDWSIVPASSSSLACAICAAGPPPPPATSRT